MIDIEAIKKITRKYIETSEFRNRIIEIYKKELENEVLKKYVKTLLGFYEFEFTGWINQQIETINKQGWNANDLTVVYVDIWRHAIQLIFSTPNGNRFDVFLRVVEDSALDKKKYNKLMRTVEKIRIMIENEILKEKVKELEEKYNNLKNELAECKQELDNCENNLNECNFDDNDDYDDDP